MTDIASQISSTMDGLTREFETIANNLANVSTTGYKRRSNDFSKSLAAQLGQDDAGNADSAGVKSIIDFSQGNTVETGRQLDFALCGKGFFVIETPDGPLYTRHGMFRLNQNGQLVDSSGRTVAGENGPITIPPDTDMSKLAVSTDGNINLNGVAAGKFKLVDFKDDEKKLVPAGENCFMAPNDAKASAADKLVVKQGYQEQSNVQMMEELVDMIMVTRLYESNMRFTSTDKDNSKSILNVAMG